VWRAFFAQWNEEITAGRRKLVPFHPRVIPPFVPRAIETQEILQNNDVGKAHARK
jgi:hypothetical protein